MKYHNTKFSRRGTKWDSAKEYGRWAQLQLLERKGEISGLQRQVKFELLPKRVIKKEVALKTKTTIKSIVDERAITYIADYVYRTRDHCIIEDCKSAMTKKLPDYIIKRKLLKQLVIDKWNEQLGSEYWKFSEYV